MKKILFSALLSLAFVACQKGDIDELTTIQECRDVTLTAVIEGTTRLSMDPAATAIELTWGEGDQIVAHYMVGDAEQTAVFTWKEGNTFTGTLPADMPAKFTNVTYNADADFSLQNGSLSDDCVVMETGEVAVDETLRFHHHTTILKPNFSQFGITSIPSGAQVTVESKLGTTTFTVGEDGLEYIYLPLGHESLEKYTTLNFAVKVGGNTYSGSTKPSSQTIIAGKLYTPPVTDKYYITYISESGVAIELNGNFYREGNTNDSNKLTYTNSYEEVGLLTFNEKVAKFGESVFAGKPLSSIVMPSNPYTIEYRAFFCCGGLKTIDISMATKISRDTFQECTSLSNVTMPKGNYEIYSNTFYKCTSLTTIDLSNATSIGNYSFGYCTSLISVKMPNSTYYMDARAFEGCSNLEEIEISKANFIGYNAFLSCSKLEYADISNASTIEYGAFSGCSSLKTVMCNQPTPPTLGEDVFYGTPDDLKIYVPEGSVETYKNTDKWSAYADKITAIPSN